MERSKIRVYLSDMVQYRRNRVEGGTYFFTVTLADRGSHLLVNEINALRGAFRITCRERPFRIDAIVILSEHLHAILTLPESDSDYSGRWRRIKGQFSRQIARTDAQLRPNQKGEYPAWQRRFWEHTIRDDEDFARHVDYIHFNPVRHGLVSRVRDWPHSSFHAYVGRGILPIDWGGDVAEPTVRVGEP